MKRTLNNSLSYSWGDNCQAWHLLQQENLSIIQELMPPGSREKLHFHRHADQFFYILEGEATFFLEEEFHHVIKGEGISIGKGKAHKIENASDSNLVFLVISQPKAHGDRINLD